MVCFKPKLFVRVYFLPLFNMVERLPRSNLASLLQSSEAYYSWHQLHNNNPSIPAESTIKNAMPIRDMEFVVYEQILSFKISFSEVKQSSEHTLYGVNSLLVDKYAFLGKLFRSTGWK